MPLPLVGGVQVTQDVRPASPIDTFRLGRLAYFVLSLCLFAGLTFAIGYAGFLGPEGGRALTNIAGFTFAAAILFLSVGRFHDMGSSGWWSLLLFVPLVGFFVWFYLLFSPPEERSETQPEVTANVSGSSASTMIPENDIVDRAYSLVKQMSENDRLRFFAKLEQG